MAPANKKSARQSKTAAKKRPRRAPALVDALAEAAWVQADGALAEALLELDELEAATDPGRRREHLALLSQALARAARKRGLSRLGAAGAEEPFDPARHEPLASRAAAPAFVEIVARGVARGEDVLAKSRVRKRP